MLATRCACGFEAITPDDMIEHVMDVIVPDDAIGTDAQPHEELDHGTCTCGFSAAIPTEMDRHFIALFTPATTLGRDGRHHQVLG
jgi:hypothetical protein